MEAIYHSAFDWHSRNAARDDLYSRLPKVWYPVRPTEKKEDKLPNGYRWLLYMTQSLADKELHLEMSLKKRKFCIEKEKTLTQESKETNDARQAK